MPSSAAAHPALHSFPTRRSSDLPDGPCAGAHGCRAERRRYARPHARSGWGVRTVAPEMTGERGPERIRLVGGSITALSFQEHLELRSEEHTSELQSLTNLVCRLLRPPTQLSTLSLHDALPIYLTGHARALTAAELSVGVMLGPTPVLVGESGL